MLNSFNYSNNIKSKNSQSKNKKFSISIYSNPYNVNFPFETNKINQNKISSMYKMTSEKIQNLNPNISNNKNKITISNILSILHSTDSQLNQPTNVSLRNNILCKNIAKKIKFPAKNYIKEDIYKHNKAISFNYNRKESKEKSLKVKKKTNKMIMDISKINRRLSILSFGNNNLKNMKKEINKDEYNLNNNITNNNITNNNINNNKSLMKKENSFHQRKNSISFRNLSNKKKYMKKINRIPMNKIINKYINVNNKKSKSNSKSKKIPNRKNSNIKERKELSYGKLSKKKSDIKNNTENTLNTTFKKETISKNLFENLDNSTEGNEFDKLQNDLESLVKKINFDNIKDNLYLFNKNNDCYISYKKKFNFLFDNDLENEII